MGYARIGVAVVDGEADEGDAGGSPVVVSADPRPLSVRGRARNARIANWTSIATIDPNRSISPLIRGIHTGGDFLSFGPGTIFWQTQH